MEVVAPSSVPMLVMVARSGTDRLAMPSPPHSMIAPTPPLTRENPQQLQADILRGDERAQMAGQIDLEHLRHGDIIRAAAHGDCHVQTTGTHGQHADAAAGGRVAVRPDKGLAGLAEALQMDLVADAVAGPGEPDAVLFCDGLDIAVVVGVFKAGLQRVVVDVGNAALCLDPGHTHGFEFQVRHRAGGVLCQCLVDFQGDLAARRHFAGDADAL